MHISWCAFGLVFVCMGCISDTSDLIMLLFALHLVPHFFIRCSIFLPVCIVRPTIPYFIAIVFMFGIGKGDQFFSRCANLKTTYLAHSVPFSINFNAQCVSYRYIRRQFRNLSPSYCIRIRLRHRLQFH